MKKNEIEIRLRVRYAETDQMGHAYYSNYLIWFEVGRTSFCRARGVVYSELEARDKIFLPVVEATCRYYKPLRYDHEFLLRTSLEELKSRALTFHYKITDLDGELVHAEGRTRHVFTDELGKPRSLPKGYRTLLHG